ncbi:winged helix-turn-helix transcriptional regulator [Pleomorphomonas sp. PLEO]|uniref:winged helix-turn-helix transcriptional regulator n=1 Tax=Pleomorphomonas sp. PLEO TaxID=3239306 RepID=UPI00351F684D
MDMTETLDVLSSCTGVTDILKRVGDKWTVQVIVALVDRPRRFNELKRHVGGVSQQMLTRTLKTLERDGVIERRVFDTTPPQVEYELTAFGRSLADPVRQLAEWAVRHRSTIHDNRLRYDAKR